MLYWYTVLMIVIHVLTTFKTMLKANYEEACVGFISIGIYLPLYGRVLGWW